MMSREEYQRLEREFEEALTRPYLGKAETQGADRRSCERAASGGDQSEAGKTRSRTSPHLPHPP